jgi:hypothetical protein
VRGMLDVLPKSARVQDEPIPAQGQQQHMSMPLGSKVRTAETEVEFADVDGTGIRSNALEFSRASRMVCASQSLIDCPNFQVCLFCSPPSSAV